MVPFMSRGRGKEAYIFKCLGFLGGFEAFQHLFLEHILLGAVWVVFQCDYLAYSFAIDLPYMPVFSEMT